MFSESSKNGCGWGILEHTGVFGAVAGDRVVAGVPLKINNEVGVYRVPELTPVFKTPDPKTGDLEATLILPQVPARVVYKCFKQMQSIAVDPSLRLLKSMVFFLFFFWFPFLLKKKNM